MSDSILVPFRIQALTTIWPLDVALVPEFPIDESPTHSFVEASNRLMRREVFITVKIGLPVFSLGVFALIAAVLNGVIFQDFAINIGTIFLMVTISVSRFLMLRKRGDEPFRQLHEKLAASKKRWLEANAIKRLTGATVQAAALRLEIETFNADIASLNLADCTAEEIHLISEKRLDLVERIGKFREKIPAILPDRLEQKLLPEKIAI